MSRAADPEGLRPEQLEVWASLATLMQRLPAALDAQLQRDSGVTHFEHGVLHALDSAPDRTLRMSALAGYAGSTLSRLSRAATRLEGKGWMRRSTDPTDGRFTLAHLTDEGHEQVTRATPGHQALVQRLVFDALTERQARQLGEISRRLAEAAGDAPAWRPPGSAATATDAGGASGAAESGLTDAP
ncbi:MarR family winged helix-turn-helix transcriptional regulator [Clavibacter phaseoli]|uniref:MarR family winged helix-turn-helix transcriptional regulator n=2 Tax=Clavibacter phaseoli TaxID=1734031 RepID=UPI001EED4DFF|nr:MarR family transcriptional regulator [Clavibacter phaseoli]UKF31732.1 MarR family transcriptional regulator [Clavibacter phaseoli]UKF37652.1 MarR family transcriptional regulator [Clavibacter phaseoli]